MIILLYYFKILKFGTCSLSINIIDTQVARRGRQYHSQPSSTKKENRSTLIKLFNVLFLTYLKNKSSFFPFLNEVRSTLIKLFNVLFLTYLK